MGFERSSDSCDWFSVVRCLTCEGRGVLDGGVLVPDFLPHVFAGGEDSRRGRVDRSCGEPLIPESALDLVRAVLRSSIVLGEGERK